MAGGGTWLFLLLCKLKRVALSRDEMASVFTNLLLALINSYRTLIYIVEGDDAGS